MVVEFNGEFVVLFLPCVQWIDKVATQYRSVP